MLRQEARSTDSGNGADRSMHTQRDRSVGWHGRSQSKTHANNYRKFRSVKTCIDTATGEPYQSSTTQKDTLNQLRLRRYHSSTTRPFLSSLVSKNENAAQFHRIPPETTQVELRKRSKKTENKSSQCVLIFLATAVFDGRSTPSNDTMRRLLRPPATTNLKPAGWHSGGRERTNRVDVGNSGFLSWIQKNSTQQACLRAWKKHVAM